MSDPTLETTAMALKQTPSQTAGPFFHYCLTPEQSGYQAFRGLAGPQLAADPAVAGRRIRVTGRVIDGLGQPLSDALIEVWQADDQGRYAHPADPRSPNSPFRGFGRTITDSQGVFAFDTVKPGAPGDGQAPHMAVILFARGSQNHLYTRIYFADEADANGRDPVLQSVPAERRRTLLAHPVDGGYAFDIRVQGGDETVFFDV